MNIWIRLNSSNVVTGIWFHSVDVNPVGSESDVREITNHQDANIVGLGSTYDPQTDRYTAPPSQLE